MTVASCTHVGATSVQLSCTPVGATLRANLAPFFVQLRSANLAPPSVQDTLHPRRCNNEYPYLLTKPVMNKFKTDVFQYPNFSTTPVDLPDHQGDSRPRMWVGGVA